MQVVILCGGQGTRIRDVADDIPKPMIPIGNRPILWHIMNGYAQYGFTDFIFSGHSQHTTDRMLATSTIGHPSYASKIPGRRSAHS